MVNAHCHLELSCLRGAIPAGGGFAAFARGMGAQRGRFDEEQRRRAIEAADARMWARGRGGRGRRGQWREYVRCEGAQRDPLPHVRRTFSACSPRRRPLSTGCCAMPPRRSRRIRPIPSPMRFSAEFAAGATLRCRSISWSRRPRRRSTAAKGAGGVVCRAGLAVRFPALRLAGRTARRERPAHAQRAARPQLLRDAADDRPCDGALHGTRVVVPLPGFEPVYLGIAPAGGAAAGERVEYLCGNRFAGFERRVVARRRTASAGRRGSAGRTPVVGDGGRCGGVGFRR